MSQVNSRGTEPEGRADTQLGNHAKASRAERIACSKHLKHAAGSLALHSVVSKVTTPPEAQHRRSRRSDITRRRRLPTTANQTLESGGPKCTCVLPFLAAGSSQLAYAVRARRRGQAG